MLSLILLGIGLGLWAGVSPGPLFAVLVSQSVRYGVKEGVKVALAPLITDPPIILITLLVLTRLQQSDLILGLLSAAGCIYVAFMAYESLFTDSSAAVSKAGAPKSIAKGVTVNFLSPHPYLFWLTAGGSLLIKAWNTSPTSAIAFVGCFYGCLVGAKLVLAVIIGRTRHMITGRAYELVMRGLGLMLAVFAVLLGWNAVSLLR